MSTDCERAFSLAKLTVSSQRNSLLGSSIESIQLLKNWIRGGTCFAFARVLETPGSELTSLPDEKHLYSAIRQ
ncbi:Uncharacterized protein HZ326_31861 [Fusarium oxysporum f. sp. albedinis]|nr:Uncharacterized protein HZ326_31861 [Fusarium oxysporum f. sp. albedinis]